MNVFVLYEKQSGLWSFATLVKRPGSRDIEKETVRLLACGHRLFRGGTTRSVHELKLTSRFAGYSSYYASSTGVELDLLELIAEKNLAGSEQNVIG